MQEAECFILTALIRKGSLLCLPTLHLFTYRTHFAGGGNSWCGSNVANSSSSGKADLGLYSGCGSSSSECSVERLLWIPAFSPQQRRAAAEAAAALTASAAALFATSGMFTGLAPAQPVGDAAAAEQAETQQQHAGVLAAVASSDSFLSDGSASDLPAAQLPHRATPQTQKDANSSAAAGSSSVVAVQPGTSPHDQQQPLQQQQQQGCVDVQAEEGAEEPDALLLLASGGDGGVLVWQVDRLARASPLCSLPGRHGLCSTR